MLLLLGSLVLGILGIGIERLLGYFSRQYSKRYSRGHWEFFGVMCLIFFMIMLITGLFTKIDTTAKIEQYYALKETIATARVNPDISPLELAAIQSEVVKMNKWLAEAKFFAHSKWLNWFVIPRVSELEPLR